MNYKKRIAGFMAVTALFVVMNTTTAIADNVQRAGTEARDGSGVVEVTNIEIKEYGGTNRVYFYGRTEERWGEVYAEMYSPSGVRTYDQEEAGQDDGEFVLACVPEIGTTFKDGYYYAVLYDIFKPITEDTAKEKGYKVYFEIKDNIVLPSWRDGAVTDVGQDIKNENVPTSGVTEGAMALKDIQGHWAEKDIRGLVQMGIVGGYKDGTFRPDDYVTRAEFAQIVKSAFHISKERDINQFSDVQKGDWFYEAVVSLYENQIVSGVSYGRFAPDERITREQMAVILFKTAQKTKLDLAVKREYIPFTDSGIVSDYAKEAVQRMYQADVINGVKEPNKAAYRFKPGDGATRAEVAAIVTKLLSRNGD